MCVRTQFASHARTCFRMRTFRMPLSISKHAGYTSERYSGMHRAYRAHRVSVAEPSPGLCPLGAPAPLEDCRQNQMATRRYAAPLGVSPARVGGRPSRRRPPRVAAASRHCLRRSVRRLELQSYTDVAVWFFAGHVVQYRGTSH